MDVLASHRTEELMPNNIDGDANWLAVIGRSLAFLCLSEADLRDKELLPQAKFLEGLGLSRNDAAQMLGTTTNSLGNLEQNARNRKKARKRVKAKRQSR
jgi:hypothetical protein